MKGVKTMENNKIERVPIHLKLALTLQGGRRVQQHRYQQDRQYAPLAQLPLRFIRRDKKAGQAPRV